MYPPMKSPIKISNLGTTRIRKSTVRRSLPYHSIPRRALNPSNNTVSYDKDIDISLITRGKTDGLS